VSSRWRRRCALISAVGALSLLTGCIGLPTPAGVWPWEWLFPPSYGAEGGSGGAPVTGGDVVPDAATLSIEPGTDVSPGTAMVLSAEGLATAPAGGEVSYTWYCGSDSRWQEIGKGVRLSWTAPTTPGIYVLRCVAVTDPGGATREASVAIRVA